MSKNITYADCSQCQAEPVAVQNPSGKDLGAGPAAEPFETVYLDTPALCFSYQGENLTFTDAAGNFYPRVTLRRCFPLSAENTFILVRVPEGDDRSHELGVLADCRELEPESLQAVLRELRQYYLTPVICKVNSIREEFGFLYWSVETDRGVKEFIMRDSIIGSTRQVASQRWLVIDINQTRYEIHDLATLDETSRALIERYLLL